MATSTTRTRATAISPSPTERATPTHGEAVSLGPATARAGSRHPGRASGEPWRADAPVPRDEGATSRLQYALSPEALYEAAQRCFPGTNWKRSVAAFELNALERCIRLSEDLNSGAYKAREPKRFTITRPKRRRCLSVGIRDRVYQRSLCDNVVYPAMTRSLVPANCACQSGKGTDHARQRLVKMLRRHWHHHGAEGYVLQMDIRGYYPNMRHDVAITAFARHLTAGELAHVSAILSRQYAGDVGFEPGSQLVQIAGISVLDGLDHFVKERLRVKAYVRYMDDMIVLGGTRAELERVRDEVAAYLAPMGMALHPDKTRIQRVGLPIPWLGFTYRLKPTGFVRVRCRAERMRDTKRRLRRLAQAAAKGSIPKATAEDVARCAVRYLEERCSGRSQARQIEKHWERQKGELWES